MGIVWLSFMPSPSKVRCRPPHGTLQLPEKPCLSMWHAAARGDWVRTFTHRLFMSFVWFSVLHAVLPRLSAYWATTRPHHYETTQNPRWTCTGNNYKKIRNDRLYQRARRVRVLRWHMGDVVDGRRWILNGFEISVDDLVPHHESILNYTVTSVVSVGVGLFTLISLFPLVERGHRGEHYASKWTFWHPKKRMGIGKLALACGTDGQTKGINKRCAKPHPFLAKSRWAVYAILWPNASGTFAKCHRISWPHLKYAEYHSSEHRLA